ncbi:MAG TPA: hypothetical protein VM241_02465 [Candidatus Thermoplasmatota archaeon]|nr:hypothetical protein [Candidatus Thermoplasmatota archaeon]
MKGALRESESSEETVATEKGRYNERAGASNAHLRKCCLPLLAAGLFGFKPTELIGFSDRPNQSAFPSGQSL